MSPCAIFYYVLSFIFNYVYVCASTCEHIHISVRRSPVARVIDSCELSDVGFENSSARAVHAESFLQPPTCVCVCVHARACMQRSEDNLCELLLSFHRVESYISPLSYLSSPRAASFVRWADIYLLLAAFVHRPQCLVSSSSSPTVEPQTRFCSSVLLALHPVSSLPSSCGTEAK